MTRIEGQHLKLPITRTAAGPTRTMKGGGRTKMIIGTVSMAGRSSPRAACAVAVLAAFCCLLADANAASDDQSVGFVFDLRGDWISTRTGKAVRATDRIYPNEQIAAPTPPRPDSWISISLYDGTAVRRTCRSQEDCDGPYLVRDLRSPRVPFLARLGRALGLLYPQEVEVMATPGVRGSGPREAVLAVTGSGVNLATALAEVRAGRYGVEFQRWTESGPSPGSVAIEVAWRQPVARVTSGTPPGPGLYQITLTDRAGDVVGGALVLLAANGDYDATDRAVERVRILSEKWADTVGDAAARRFLVESLVALARDPAIATGEP
jgi:hypothetical protein